MRTLRLILIVVVMALSVDGLSRPAMAQSDGVGFEDLTGLQNSVNRTYTGVTDFSAPAEPIAGIRDAARPEVMLMLAVVYTFDTEANAVAGFDLLKTDMNATGASGQPLPLTEVPFGLGIPHIATVARETAVSPPIDFTLVMAQDGTLVYTVIAITRGAPPKGAITSVMQAMASTETATEPPTLRTNGTSTGGVWAKMPSAQLIAFRFRGVQSVADTVPFSA